jgi:hypothetical protein
MANWTEAFGGATNGAKPAGHEATGESVYVARAMIAGGYQLGKVRQAFGAAYIPFGGVEKTFDNYQFLMDPDTYFPVLPGAPTGSAATPGFPQ